MGIKNTLKKIVTGASIVLASYLPMNAIAQNEINDDQNIDETEEVDKSLEGKINFATLENSITDNSDPRIRGIVNANANYENIEVGYWGLHETNGERYFSRNVPSIGIKGIDTKLCAVMIANEGKINIKYGIRNTSLPRAIGDYGWMTLSGNFKKEAESGNLNKKAELAFFIGKDLGKGFSAGIFNATNYNNGDIINIYEFQINKEITKYLSLFTRFEKIISNKTNTNYVGGIIISK